MFLLFHSFEFIQNYMPNSCESSIFLEYCNEEEILGIINNLQNGIASDIPIVAIKVARTVILPYLTTFYNSCMASGIFSKDFKISKITHIPLIPGECTFSFFCIKFRDNGQ